MAKTEIKIEKNFGSINSNNLRTNPSMLGIIVNELSKVISPALESNEKSIPFDIEEKITHNDLSKYRYLIEDYSLYNIHLVNIYSSVEESYPDAKDKIYRYINREYRKIKGDLIKQEAEESKTTLDIIKEHCDLIVERVIKQLNLLLSNSGNLDDKLLEEDITASIELIVGDAFVECKLLENPNKNE